MKEAFDNWLQRIPAELGALDAACLRPGAVRAAGLRKHFAAWLDAGNRGALPYIDESIATRADPFVTRPWVRSVLVLTFRGDWGRQDLAPALPAPAPERPVGYVSRYACGGDYHAVGRMLIEKLAARLAEFAGGAVFRHEAGVDTQPIPEVFLAVEGGLGALGRNGLVRTPQHGSRVFVGCLFTSLALPEARRQAAPLPACAECGACVRACPTGALIADGIMRVRRCRTWLSMEYRGALTREQQGLLGDSLLGCDACTASCPPAAAQAGMPVDLEWLLRAPTAEIRRRIRATALAHAGPTLLKRNAAAILGRQLRGAERAGWRAWILAHSQSPMVRETVLQWDEA